MSHERVREEVVEELTRKLLGATGSGRKRIVCMEGRADIYYLFIIKDQSLTISMRPDWWIKWETTISWPCDINPPHSYFVLCEGQQVCDGKGPLRDWERCVRERGRLVGEKSVLHNVGRHGAAPIIRRSCPLQ